MEKTQTSSAILRHRLGDGRQYGESLEQIKINHLMRYQWAATRVAGQMVYDVGCGVGYGSYVLSDQASRVVGLDFNPGITSLARAQWQAPNLEFQTRDLADGIPQGDPCVVVVAFEVIEHLVQPELLLSSIPVGSTLIGSVPNEAIVQHTIDLNPFHIRHFNHYDVESLFGSCGFEIREWHSQRFGEIKSGKEIDKVTIFVADRVSNKSSADMDRYRRELLREFLRRCNVINDLKNGSKAIKPNTAY